MARATQSSKNSSELNGKHPAAEAVQAEMTAASTGGTQVGTVQRFSERQIDLMRAKLNGEHVRQRMQAGRELSYIEGYHAIGEANRIFGFGAWSSEVLKLDCVVSPKEGLPNFTVSRDGQAREGYQVAYVATVRVTVHFPDGDQRHEDAGYGRGIDYADLGQAYESAVKEAVTDAEKRALRHWGSQFGLALYDKDQREVDYGEKGAPQQASLSAADAPYGICAEHNVPYFLRGQMRTPAHRLPPGAGEGWCNKPSARTEVGRLLRERYSSQAQTNAWLESAMPGITSTHPSKVPESTWEALLEKLMAAPEEAAA